MRPSRCDPVTHPTIQTNARFSKRSGGHFYRLDKQTPVCIACVMPITEGVQAARSHNATGPALTRRELAFHPRKTAPTSTRKGDHASHRDRCRLEPALVGSVDAPPAT
ncbi:hypothetical protein Pd630_LPD07101 [Rhodococcus opacus PD630]|nr:hypothetical protein Pd630_LPD07101 [Rhodococcus opacus PD630]